MTSDYQHIKHAERTGEYDHSRFVRKTSDTYKMLIMGGVALASAGAYLAFSAVFPMAAPVITYTVSAVFGLMAGTAASTTIGEKILKNKRYSYHLNPNRPIGLKRKYDI